MALPGCTRPPRANWRKATGVRTPRGVQTDVPPWDTTSHGGLSAHRGQKISPFSVFPGAPKAEHLRNTNPPSNHIKESPCQKKSEDQSSIAVKEIAASRERNRRWFISTWPPARFAPKALSEHEFVKFHNPTQSSTAELQKTLRRNRFDNPSK